MPVDDPDAKLKDICDSHFETGSSEPLPFTFYRSTVDEALNDVSNYKAGAMTQDRKTFESELEIRYPKKTKEQALEIIEKVLKEAKKRLKSKEEVVQAL